MMTGQLLFDEAPDALDQVELRAIRWEPEHADPLRVCREPRAQRRGLVVGRVIQHQHPMVLRPAGRDLLEERGEFDGGGCGSLSGGQHARPILHGSEEGDPLIGSGGRDAGGLTALAPAMDQVGMGMKLAFVEIQEAESTGEISPFFCSTARVLAALATTSASCRCRKSCRGRR